MYIGLINVLTLSVYHSTGNILQVYQSCGTYQTVVFIVSNAGSGSSHTIRDHADFALFPVLPNPVRHVEKQTLETIRLIVNYIQYNIISAYANVMELNRKIMIALQTCF